ncbi:hypothetical protein KKI23_03770 [Patescibacteria group bacterium]|nr:hypothetical protein [Patescibacteria group bacterium]
MIQKNITTELLEKRVTIYAEGFINAQDEIIDRFYSVALDDLHSLGGQAAGRLIS